METHSSQLPETLRKMSKLCVSTKLPYQEIRWNFGILSSGMLHFSIYWRSRSQMFYRLNVLSKFSKVAEDTCNGVFLIKLQCKLQDSTLCNSHGKTLICLNRIMRFKLYLPEHYFITKCYFYFLRRLKLYWIKLIIHFPQGFQNLKTQDKGGFENCYYSLLKMVDSHLKRRSSFNEMVIICKVQTIAIYIPQKCF